MLEIFENERLLSQYICHHKKEYLYILETSKMLKSVKMQDYGVALCFPIYP